MATRSSRATDIARRTRSEGGKPARNRLDAFPDAIAEALLSPLRREAGLAYLARLHGGPDRKGRAGLAACLESGETVDAFLARLFRSPRCAGHLAARLSAFVPASPDRRAAELRRHWPELADPDHPLFWRLREVAEAQAGPDVAAADDRGPAIRSAHALAELMHDAAAASDGSALLARLVARIDGQAGRTVLSIMAEMPDWRLPALPPPETVPHPGLAEAVRAVLAPIAPPDAATRRMGADLVRWLAAARPDWAAGPPRRIALDVPPAQRAAWAATLPHADGGDGPDGGTLRLDGTTARAGREPALLPALLRWAPAGGESFDLVRDEPAGLSWRDALPDGPEAGETVIEGRFDAGGGTRGALRLPPAARSAPLRPTPMSAAPPRIGVARPYAILLMPEDADLPDWDNAENCVCATVASDLAALARDGAARRVPVVTVGPEAAPGADWLTRMVRHHWSVAGAHAVTDVPLRFDPMRQVLSPWPDAALTHLAPLARTVLPLALAARLDPDDPLTAAGLASARPGGPIAVASDRPGPATPAGLLRRLAQAVAAPDLAEAIARIGPCDAAALDDVDPVAHWPIADRLARAGMREARLARALARDAAHPDAATAADVLMAADGGVPARAKAGFDAFAVGLAGAGSRLDALPDDHLRRFLVAAVDCVSVSAVAAALARQAEAIAARRHSLLTPLTELLAYGLPEAETEAVLARMARMPEIRGNTYRRRRMAQALGRFAPAARLADFAADLSTAEPDWLEDAGLRLQLRRLILSDLPESAVAAVLDADARARIAAEMDPRDRLIEALRAGRPDALAAGLADLGGWGRVGLMRLATVLAPYASDLRALGLRAADVPLPEAAGPLGARLLAVLLSDRARLAELDAAGLLGVGDGSSDGVAIAARQQLGDAAPLDDLIARAFAATPEARGLIPPRIAGATFPAVVSHATATTAGTRGSDADGPLVSVVLTAWNPDPALLDLSVRSVLDQSHASLELLVVDDGSDAPGAAHLAALAGRDPRIRVLRQDRNGGPYQARNAALARAQGTFVAIQDADDWSHPDRLAAQVAAMTARPEAAAVTSAHLRIDGDGLAQFEHRFALLGDGPMSTLYRRVALDAVGPFAPTRSRGDVEMRQRLAAYFGRHALPHLAAPLMLCFAGSGTLSRRTAARRSEALQMFRAAIDRQAPLWGLRRDGLPVRAIHRPPVPSGLRPDGGTA